MKLIIAGSRTLSPNLGFIDFCFEKAANMVTEIVSGGAKGVDRSGEAFADGMGIPVKKFEADWDAHGSAAGPIRNKQMAEYADKLLLIWDGESKGSANMKRQMQKLNKPILEVIIREL
jgi:hypothetical protein